MANSQLKEYSVAELWEKLEAEDELILTIFNIDEQKIRKGLIKAKSKAREKLLQAGIVPSNQELQFKILPKQDYEDKDTCRLHCLLIEKDKIPVLDLIVPGSDF